MISGPRPIGRVNWYGAWTLYQREVWRFLKTPVRSILAPTATSLLFLAIFSLALGGTVRDMAGVPLIDFLAPGLAMMAIVQASFENAAGSLVQAKLLGNIVDILMPPLGPGEVTAALVLGGATRGMMTGAILIAAMQPFVTLIPSHAAFALFFALAASLLLAMVGLVTGLWAAKWDHLAAVTNFTVMPLMFLSGTFYSIERLPDAWRTASQLNPMFYMIDGFRYGFTGVADGSLAAGLAVAVVLGIALWLVCHRLIAVGYKIKS
ncbi:MAG: ABC transporter permease [Alphaproteobacteria bacterium]